MSGEPPDVRRRRPPGLAEAGAPPRGEIGEPVARRAATSSSLRFISASGPPSCRDASHRSTHSAAAPLAVSTSRTVAVPAPDHSARGDVASALEALRRDTDAFLAVELPEGEGEPPTLRAVGSEDDLERIQSELRGFE